MTASTESWEKGELVPGPGTYRCTECGEIWATAERNVRFPPCEVSKSGRARWLQVDPDAHQPVHAT